MRSTTDINNRVSVKQLIIIMVVMSISPIVRFLPAFAAKSAQEVGWVTPFAAIPPTIVIVYFIHSIFNKYKDSDMTTPDIIKDILGKYLGTAALFLHLMWILFLNGLYVRYNAERLVSTIYPNIDMNYFIIITLIVVAYILLSGETAIARMGEILFPILLIVITFSMLLLIPKVRPDALLPISFSDVVPILKGSIGTLSVYSYLFLMFLFSDNIIGKATTKKLFLKGVFVLQFIIFMVSFTTIGLLGSSVAVRAPIPFLITVKQISIADTIENIESVVIAIWMLSDTLIISTMSLIVLNLAKAIFGLSDTKSFIKIFFVLFFLLANGIAKHRIELDLFAGALLVYINVAIGFGTPILLFVVGKLRHKI